MPSPLRAHWLLDPEIAYLNHGSFGACPREVLAAQAALRERMEREPVRFFVHELQGLLDTAREELAPFVGAAPEDLAFVPNATTGVNAVLRSLELAPEDEVIYSNHGYNACNNTVRFACERAGARAVKAQIPFPIAGPDGALEAVLAAVTPRTRLAVIDHVTSPTGLVLPIARIVSELRERGIETLVDGAHAPGMLALDLDALGAGYYTGNPHKWMCAPKGAGLLHVRRDLQPNVRPVVISHGASEPKSARTRFLVEFDWVGTVDPTPALSIPAAQRFLGGLFPGGWDELRRRNRALVLHGRKLLLDALGIDAPAPEEMIGSLATVPLPDAEPAGPRSAFTVDPLQAALFEEHKIEVPVSAWPSPGQRVLRISAQAYNAPEDYARLATAVKALL